MWSTRTKEITLIDIRAIEWVKGVHVPVAVLANALVGPFRVGTGAQVVTLILPKQTLINVDALARIFSKTDVAIAIIRAKSVGAV